MIVSFAFQRYCTDVYVGIAKNPDSDPDIYQDLGGLLSCPMLPCEEINEYLKSGGTRLSPDASAFSIMSCSFFFLCDLFIFKTFFFPS